MKTINKIIDFAEQIAIEDNNKMKLQIQFDTFIKKLLPNKDYPYKYDSSLKQFYSLEYQGFINRHWIKFKKAKRRLEEIRIELIEERISYGEILELNELINYIELEDLQLLEVDGEIEQY